MIDAARGVDSILHLAYVNGTEFFYSKPALVLDVGVRGMINVLDACRRHGIRELVLASSSEVYQTPPSIPTPENVPLSVPDPLNPRYSYGGGKIICELMAINYGRQDFDRVLIFRPHNVYGPDMGWEHVLPQFALRLETAVRRSSAGGSFLFPSRERARKRVPSSTSTISPRRSCSCWKRVNTLISIISAPKTSDRSPTPPIA